MADRSWALTSPDAIQGNIDERRDIGPLTELLPEWPPEEFGNANRGSGIALKRGGSQTGFAAARDPCRLYLHRGWERHQYTQADLVGDFGRRTGSDDLADCTRHDISGL